MRMLAPIGYPQSPTVSELWQWSVWEVEDDDGSRARLLSGLLVGSQTRVRLTSQIAQSKGHQMITRSGSVYTLVGPAATQEEVEAQENHRIALLAGRVARNVTSEYGVLQ